MSTNLYKLSDIELLERIGSNFKRMRLLMNISQKKLSKIAGIDRTTLMRFENGGAISVLYLIKLFRAIRRLEEIDRAFLVPRFTPDEVRIILKKRRKKASKS